MELHFHPDPDAPSSECLMGPVPFQGWPEKLDALAVLPPTRKHIIRFE